MRYTVPALALAFACAFTPCLVGCSSGTKAAGSDSSAASAVVVVDSEALGVWEMARLEMGGSVIRDENEYKKNQGSSKNTFLEMKTDGTYTLYGSSVTHGTWKQDDAGAVALASDAGEKIVGTIASDVFTWVDSANDIKMIFNKTSALPKGLQ